MEKIVATKKVRRFKHGVTVFKVYTYQDRGQTPVAVVEQLFITSRPFYSSSTDTLFANYARRPGIPRTQTWYSSMSLRDAHVIGTQTYNLHRLFFSRKKAESYAKLVRSGCDVSSMFPGERIDWDEAADDIDAGWHDMFDDVDDFGE